MFGRTLLLSAAAAMLAFGQAPPAWKAGVAKTVITPKEPIWMAGYGARTKPSEGVRHDIHVKALALQTGSGAPAVIVAADILGFTREMSAAVAERCRKQFGLTRDRIALTATHTHSGPVAGKMLLPAYDVKPEHIVVIDRYTNWLIDQTVRTIGEAIRGLQPASLSFSQTAAGFGVNRRHAGNRVWPGPVDHDVPVLAVRGAGGQLRAVLFGYACHNTSLGDYKFSGDWAGYAQIEIEKDNPGALALFVAGAGADMNPLPRQHEDDRIPTLYGKILSIAVGQALTARSKPISGELSTAFETVDLPFHKPPTKDELTAALKTEKMAPKRRQLEHLLAQIAREGKLPSKYPYPIQIWKLGGQLNWIVLGGEVVTDYALRLKGQYGWDTTWVTAYSNDVFAYIPSLRVLKEGGYEGGGAMVPYGQPGPFSAAVEEIVIEKIEDLMKAGAKPSK